MNKIPTRDEALAILRQYNQSESLQKHALAVEAVMLHFAGIYQAPNPHVWGVIGLLHDLDYEMYPEQHCVKTAEILEGLGIDGTITRAAVSHGYGICSEVKPESAAEKVLYTIDELTGLIAAAVLMRPTQSILDFSVKSLKKKFKTSSFAAGVDRSIITRGAAAMGWELDEVFTQTIIGMQKAADRLGMTGNVEK